MSKNNASLNEVLIWLEKIHQDSLRMREEICSSSRDIDEIVAHTKFPRYIIEEIKDHLFIRKYRIGDELREFSPHEDILAAWDRLRKGTFVKSDLMLVRHAVAEAHLMQELDIDYKEAHEVANRLSNWDSHYQGLEAK
jgi:uncharacterized protein YfeS